MKGFPGLPGNMGEMMKKAQKLQENLKTLQDNAGNFTGEGSAGGGVVKVKANGKFEILAVTIDPQVVNASDVEMLQDLILAATNDAIKKAQDQVKGEMTKLTGGMQIPGLF